MNNNNAPQAIETLLANIPGMAYRCPNDKLWPMDFVSAGCTALTEYSASDLISKKPAWGELIHQDDRDYVWSTVQEALQADKKFEIQYRFSTKSGQIRWAWERGRGVQGSDGISVVIEGFVTDITRLRKTEVDLQRSNALLEGVVSAAVDGIVTINARGIIKSFNQAAERLFGHSANQILGADIQQLITVTNRKQYLQYMNQYVNSTQATQSPVRLQVLAKRRNGSPLPAQITISEIFLNPERCFALVIRDLTEQKATAEALRQEHERLSLTLDYAPMGIVTYHFDGRIGSANLKICEVTGYATHELKAMTIHELTCPNDRHEAAELMAKAELGDLTRFTLRQQYLRKDGAAIDVEVVNAITHDANGKPDLIIGLVNDLTPRLRAEAEAREHLEQLAHADRLNALGEMATGIAHEINQPLTAISLFAQAGKRLFNAQQYDRMDEIWDKLSQHAQRAGSIIERMHTMARRQDSSKELADCNDLVAEIAKLAEAEARFRDITIALELCNEPLPVVVDVVQIQQVALNLLRNGMDAMQSSGHVGGSTIKLQTRSRHDGTVQVAIIDSGCGVSEEAAKNLFTQFSTTKESGMGMGLPISRAIVATHGGQIEFHNNDGSGATFMFSLPRAGQGTEDE